MVEATSSARIVLTTAASHEEANRMGRKLVEERLAACATLVPTVESIYRWKDEIETSTETLLLLKTDAAHLAAVEVRLNEMHSYQTPEFLVLSVDAGSQRYLNWMRASLQPVEQAAEMAKPAGQ